MKKFAGDNTECEKGFISSEDTTCQVDCECGYVLWASNHGVAKCPICGKGYRTEFVVWQYDVGEDSE
jgi:hypothetical protein